MIQGLSSNSAVSQVFQNNRADAGSGRYQNISGPNDVADKTASLVLNTAKTISKGLINALNLSVANLDRKQDNGNAGSQYNDSGRLTIGTNQIGNILSKIV
ncbi:MAG TPA: hypothetical protein ENI54_03380 [bacterium]|nr:hypothetical protein [bacterium]